LFSMVVFSFVLLAGLTLPQTADLTSVEVQTLYDRHPTLYTLANRLVLTEVFRSWLLLAVIAPLLYNLLFNLLRRLRGLRTELEVYCPPLAPEHVIDERERRVFTCLDAERALLSAHRSMERAGYRVAEHVGTASLRGVRGRYAVVGSVVFHASLILLIIGGVMSARYRFHGFVILGESEEFNGSAEQFVGFTPENTEEDDLPQVAFRVRSVEVDVDDDDHITDARLFIEELAPIGHSKRLLRVNEPYHAADGSAVRFSDYGFAPLFELRRAPDDTRPRIGAFKLILTPPGQPDQFAFPMTMSEFEVRLFPDFVAGEKGPSSRSRALENPVAFISHKGKQARGPEVMLPLGGTVQVGPYWISMPKILYWARLEIDRDPGKNIVYLSLMLGLLGLCWRLLWQRSWLYVTVERRGDEAMLHIAGSSEYTRRPFADRFKTLVDVLEKEHAK